MLSHRSSAPSARNIGTNSMVIPEAEPKRWDEITISNPPVIMILILIIILIIILVTGNVLLITLIHL